MLMAGDNRGIQEIGREEARTLATLQYERWNDLLSQTWPIANDPSPPRFFEAVNATLRIMERIDGLARQ